MRSDDRGELSSSESLGSYRDFRLGAVHRKWRSRLGGAQNACAVSRFVWSEWRRPYLFVSNLSMDGLDRDRFPLSPYILADDAAAILSLAIGCVF